MDPRSETYLTFEQQQNSGSFVHPSTLKSKKELESWRDGYKEKYLAAFCQKLEELLIAMETVFHECETTKEMHNDLNKFAKNSAIIRRKIINTWHEKLEKVYPKIEAKDETVLKDMKNFDLFLKLKIAEKWNDAGFDDESKENFWMFIIYLNWLANGYNYFSSF